jgi:broad specificity phosphatase PhoE
MTLLALVRHMPTAWNVAGRLQGRADQPLDPATPDWRVPPALAGFRWLSSPLRRATDTAARLGIDDFEIEPRLTEMDWGDWEGRILAELRAGLGRAMAENEAAGLDFRPPGGESPRDVQERLKPLLVELAVAGRATAAITHKGVIRAVYGFAVGWDMCSKPPHRLSSAAAHLFRLDGAGVPAIERLNIAMRL